MISEKYFNQLGVIFDLSKLRIEVNAIIDDIGTSANNQISLVHRQSHAHDCWFDGTGTSFLFDDNRHPVRDTCNNIVRRFTEDEFCFLNPGIEGSELARVYNELGKVHKVSRYRIAILNPKSCYGWHVDEEVRIHIPVFTTPGSFLITDDGVATHLPSDGNAYIFRANNGYHTAINSDYTTSRIHLLINII